MKRDYVYLIVIIILAFLFIYDRCNQSKRHKKELQATTNSAASLLQDTLTKITSKKDTVWQIRVSELTPEQIKESELWGNLNYEKQLLLTELARYKNLVASMQVNFTGTKIDTITQVIRIPVYHAFTLAWMDTVGGFTWVDTVYIDSNMTRRVFIPKLQFTPDVRIVKTKRNGIEGELRILGLEEFNLQGQHIYSFYTANSPADIRRKKWSRFGKIMGYVGSNSLSFYLGTKLK